MGRPSPESTQHRQQIASLIQQWACREGCSLPVPLRELPVPLPPIPAINNSGWNDYNRVFGDSRLLYVGGYEGIGFFEITVAAWRRREATSAARLVGPILPP
jgi:hypothetical protein